MDDMRAEGPPPTGRTLPPPPQPTFPVPQAAFGALGGQPGTTPSPRPTRHRRHLVVGIGGVVLILVAGLTTALTWPRAAAVEQVVASTVHDLGQWPGVTYSGVVDDPDGVVTGVQLTVTSAGVVDGTLTRDFGGTAQFVADSTGILLRGNAAWWLWTQPGAADSLANTWIQNPSTADIGLDPASQLTPTALATALPDPNSPGWTRTGATVVDGRSALVLADGTSQITVTAAAPHRLLSTTLPLSSGWWWVDHTVGAADSFRGTAEGARGAAGVITAALPVDGGAVAEPPPAEATFSVSDPTPKQMTQATQGVRALRDSQIRPRPLTAAIPVQPQVSVSISAGSCSTPECAATVNVTNSGTTTASGTLYVTVAGQTALDTAISVPAGETVPYVANATNTAPSGATIQVQWLGVLYDAAVMGDNPDLAKQLAGRGVNIDKAFAAGQPSGQAILQVLDALTAGVDPTTDPGSAQQVTDAQNIIANTVKGGAFTPLYYLANSGNLVLDGPAAVADLNRALGNVQLGTVRELEEAAQLAQAGNKVVYGTSYSPPGSTTKYQADILNLTQHEAFQMKTITGSRNQVRSKFQEAVNQLQGRTGETPPPGFAKIVLLNLEPGSGDGMSAMPRSALLTALRDLQLGPKCAPNGTPIIDKIIVTNYPPGSAGAPVLTTNEFTCADLQP